MYEWKEKGICADMYGDRYSFQRNVQGWTLKSATRLYVRHFQSLNTTGRTQVPWHKDNSMTFGERARLIHTAI